METITPEVHSITPTSSRNTLATIYKSILIIFAFNFLCIYIYIYIFFFFFFWAYYAWTYKRGKKYSIMLSFKHHNFAMSKHTNVFHDWQALLVRWLFIHFSYDFLVLLVKKSDMSVKYKKLLNLTNHKHEPQNSLA